MADERDGATYHQVTGGPELLRWFGRVPSFHDAEVLSLDLRRDGMSFLRVHGGTSTATVGDDGTYVLDRHAGVTFALGGIMDLQLEGFSIQNVIGALVLRRAPNRPERSGFLALDSRPEDIEIELEPCYGLNGVTRARSVEITCEPGKPAVV